VNNLEPIMISVIAVGFLAWPMLQAAPAWFAWLASGVGGKKTVSYQAAVGHLAHVRSRLLDTEGLDEPQRAAIDVLTLALVNGSDQ
jgi:hypothetical protein